MSNFKIVPAGHVYASILAPNLRESDIQEIKASSGMEPLEALIGSVDVSDEDMCWAATLDGEPVAMFGANNLLEGEFTVGGIWMLCSDEIYKNKKDFMRKCRKYLAKMHERYKYLTNYIDGRNRASMKWLPALGFVPCQEIKDFGEEKRLFIQYVSKRK